MSPDRSSPEPPSEPVAHQRRRLAWGPFVLMLAVGAALVGLGLGVELGRLRVPLTGAGVLMCILVGAIFANRLVARRSRAAR